ncbi:hypothetical protein BK749_21745 [Bacillus thuringiensis serovar vazensis]|uniref:Uncharacterized protein n=1 Tax=Bacillus thuringiensis serovar vazensis TaxID=180867 RepID=A0A243CUB8_BACTU|nr:hypothetical protein BK749_21745 [Bacillus thuringiensis serovar vazensis]
MNRFSNLEEKNKVLETLIVTRANIVPTKLEYLINKLMYNVESIMMLRFQLSMLYLTFNIREK